MVSGTPYFIYLFSSHFSYDLQLSLTRVFASHSHQGSVNALAAKDKWIASGGADDRIELIDMESRTKECSIQHEGTKTVLFGILPCFLFLSLNAKIVSQYCVCGGNYSGLMNQICHIIN